MNDKITILLFISGVCLGGDAALSPGPVYGAVGGSVWINTTIRPTDKPLRITWWDHEGKRVASSYGSNVELDPAYRDRVILDTHTGSLELKGLNVSDSGQYTVSITKTSETSEIKDQTILHVIERISGVSLTGPAQPLIEDQSSAVLTCEGTGSIITTEWMKDGQPLSPSNSIIFSADLRSVSISPVRRSDSGEYQCRLSNPVSSDTATYTMTVNYGPENVAISGPNEVEVGSKVTLTCSAESTPPASFIWMLNGRETGETTASYSIEKINYTDSGNYTCTVWNNVTSLNTTVHHHLTVKDEGSLSGGGGALSGGAIAGIIIGVIVGIGGVAGLVFYFTKSKNRSLAASGKDKQGNNTSHQQDNGDTDVNYADVRLFRKANGEQVQLGNVGGANTVYSDIRGNTAANQRPPQVDHETQYSQIARHGVQTSPVTYAQVKKK